MVSEAHGLAAEDAPIRTTAGVMTEGTRTLEVDGGELPPPPPPATTPPAQMTQVESQRHADAMAAEALRLATEAAQLNAAAVLMRAMSAALERHQSDLGGVGEVQDVVLRSEVLMEEGDEDELQTTAGAMGLETQMGASNAGGDEAQGTGMDESEVAGGGGGRRKRLRPQVHNNRAAHSGQHRKKGGRYKRERDGRDG